MCYNAALNELKYYLVELLFILILYTVVTREYKRMLKLFPGIAVIIYTSMILMYYLYPYYSAFYALLFADFSHVLREPHHINPDSLGRHDQIEGVTWPIRNYAESIRPSLGNLSIVTGLGLGNAELSTNGRFDSAFYLTNIRLWYWDFIQSMIYIETGIIGLVIYNAAWFIIPIRSYISYIREKRGNDLMKIMMCVMVIFVMIYDASMRNNYGYMMWAFLGITYAVFAGDRGYVREKANHKLTYMGLYKTISILGLISSLGLWISGIVPLEQSTLSTNSVFSDYFFHIGYSYDPANLYHMSSGAVFPPLTYILYYLLGRLNPLPDSIDPLDWIGIKNYGGSLLIFLVYSIIVAVVLIECIRLYIRNTEQERKALWIALLIIGSYPFMCTSFQRGNIIALVSAMLSLALLWMDDPDKHKRETALVLIAVSACFKITPAFLGIWYLYDRRYKELLRLIIYTVILFFVPFVFFGGADGFVAFLHNLSVCAHKDEWNWGTIRGFTFFMVTGYVSEAHKIFLGYLCENLFLIICIVCGWISKEKWRRAFFICMVLVSYLHSNYIYTLTYLLAPMVFLLRDDGDKPVEEVGLTVATCGLGMVFRFRHG